MLLHKLLNLKSTCFIKYLCKAGVPIKSLSKYLQALREREINYIVYDNINGELEVKEDFEDRNNTKLIKNIIQQEKFETVKILNKIDCVLNC